MILDDTVIAAVTKAAKEREPRPHTRDERKANAVKRKLMGGVARQVKAQRTHSVRGSMYKKKLGYPPTQQHKSVYNTDKSSEEPQYISFLEALQSLDDENDVSQGDRRDVAENGDQPRPSRQTHVILTGDLIFLHSQDDGEWWAAIAAEPIPNVRRRPKCEHRVFWLESWDAERATSADFVLTKSSDKERYESIIKDAHGNPIVSKLEQHSSEWRTQKLVYTLNQEIIDAVEEAIEAEEADAAREARSQNGEEEEEEEEDPDEDEENPTPRSVSVENVRALNTRTFEQTTTTKSGRRVNKVDYSYGGLAQR